MAADIALMLGSAGAVERRACRNAAVTCTVRCQAIRAAVPRKGAGEGIQFPARGPVRDEREKTPGLQGNGNQCATCHGGEGQDSAGHESQHYPVSPQEQELFRVEHDHFIPVAWRL